MTSTQHDTFTIERNLPAPPARVFAAFATEDGKQRWFGGPPDQFTLLRRAFDFRIGGHEHLSGRWPTGTVSKFDCTYLDIVANARIVYVYEMHLDDRKISVSLATLEFKWADGGATRLVVTEQGAFLDGYDDAGSRRQGTNGLLDRMAETLK
jgi:uncharacterized protein YndB with AHSA1/START domain